MLNAKLVIVGGGDAKVSEIQLHLPTTIGRSRDAKVKLPHPLVSRQHCEVFERDGQLFVRDLGSLNGTYVDSQKIETEQALQPNHLLTLGTVTFRAIYETAIVGARAHQEEQSDVGTSERPTDRAPVAANAKPIRQPPIPQSEIETENDRAASDTDSNLAALGQIDFLDAVEPQKNLPEVSSSIFSLDQVPSSNGSVSHNVIAKLPGAPEPGSFEGGLQPDDDKTTQPVPAASPHSKLDATDGDSADRKSIKRRPR